MQTGRRTRLGLVYGWSGVGAQGSGVRFVAFGMPKSTIVAAVRARDGHVLQSKVVRGFYGVPLVTYDGSSGGLSGDGTSLALASYGPYPGQAGKTRFVLLSTRTLGVLRQVVLPGSWSYDAISPDGSMLYLVEHISAGPKPALPRAFLRSERPTADPRRGRRPARERVRHGRSARDTRGELRRSLGVHPVRHEKHEPFVHALDTVRREAFCTHLPLRLGQAKQMELRLRLAAGRSKLSVTRNGRPLAAIDTRSFEVQRG